MEISRSNKKLESIQEHINIFLGDLYKLNNNQTWKQPEQTI